jgi:hypothetical protein
MTKLLIDHFCFSGRRAKKHEQSHIAVRPRTAIDFVTNLRPLKNPSGFNLLHPHQLLHHYLFKAYTRCRSKRRNQVMTQTLSPSNPNSDLSSTPPIPQCTHPVFFPVPCSYTYYSLRMRRNPKNKWAMMRSRGSRSKWDLGSIQILISLYALP